MPLQEKEKKKEIIDLVVARLEILPSNVQISIGSSEAFTRDQLIEHVKKDDKVGKKIVEVELEYLRLLKKGIFYEEPLFNNKATI